MCIQWRWGWRTTRLVIVASASLSFFPGKYLSDKWKAKAWKNSWGRTCPDPPQLFEAREQFPHNLAQAHEWPLFFPIITKFLYSAFEATLSFCVLCSAVVSFEISTPVILAWLMLAETQSPPLLGPVRSCAESHSLSNCVDYCRGWIMGCRSLIMMGKCGVDLSRRASS